MPAKFMVQRFVKTNSKGDKIWADTVWNTLEEARRQYPDETYREVMTQW